MKKILLSLLIVSFLNAVFSQTHQDESIYTQTMRSIQHWNLMLAPGVISDIYTISSPTFCSQRLKKIVATEDNYDLQIKYAAPEDWEYVLSGKTNCEPFALPYLNRKPQYVTIHFTIEIKPRKEDKFDYLIQYEFKNIRVVFDDLINYPLYNDTIMYARYKTFMTEIQKQHCQWKIDDNFFRDMNYLVDEINTITDEIDNTMDEEIKNELIEKKDDMLFLLNQQRYMLSSVSSELRDLGLTLKNLGK